MEITIILVRKNELHEFDNPLIAKAFIITLQCNQFFTIMVKHNGKLIYYENETTKCQRIYDLLSILTSL